MAIHKVEQFFVPEEAIWKPLEAVIENKSELAGFMFMGIAVTEQGSRIHLYKHRDTRLYTNIDEELRFYRLENAGRHYAEIGRHPVSSEISGHVAAHDSAD